MPWNTQQSNWPAITLVVYWLGMGLGHLTVTPSVRAEQTFAEDLATDEQTYQDKLGLKSRSVLETRKEGNHTKKAALSPLHKGSICLEPALPPPPQESTSSKSRAAGIYTTANLFGSQFRHSMSIMKLLFPFWVLTNCFLYETVRSARNLRRQNAAVQSHEQSGGSYGLELKSESFWDKNHIRNA